MTALLCLALGAVLVGTPGLLRNGFSFWMVGHFAGAVLVGLLASISWSLGGYHYPTLAWLVGACWP
ncbi:MAG: hypothetical protein HC923_09105 [Myxococcales bacterium]|nr:hypothetical protein [Myxococcales bacterium]